MKTKILISLLIILVLGICLTYWNDNSLTIFGSQIKVGDISAIASVITMVTFLFFLYFSLYKVYGGNWGFLMMIGSFTVGLLGWYSVSKFLLESWPNFIYYIISLSFSTCSTGFISSLSVNCNQNEIISNSSVFIFSKKKSHLYLISILIIIAYLLYFTNINNFEDSFFLALSAIIVMMMAIKFNDDFLGSMTGLPTDIMLINVFAASTLVCKLLILLIVIVFAQIGINLNSGAWWIPSIIVGLLVAFSLAYMDFMAEGNTG